MTNNSGIGTALGMGLGLAFMGTILKDSGMLPKKKRKKDKQNANSWGGW